MSEFGDEERTNGEAVNSCTPPADVGPYFAVNDSPTSMKDSTMNFDTAATTELPKLNLPQDLLTEVKRGSKSKADFGVEAMKPSMFDRFVEKLLGKGR